MMGHSVETMMGWEWDSLLLLVNPAVADTSDGGGVVGDALLDSAARGFSVGQSWPEFEDFDNGPGILMEEEEETQQQQFAKTKPQFRDSTEKAGNEERRDPRLDCPNFLAGRVPCACSDNEDEEDERGGSHSKRVKLSARCQVPACGADLASLKSYHRRHRVCLHCANATSVKLHQRLHRYCQQCGRFHVLSDFDEEKRSCRQKLERHNNRRRQKVQESGEDATTITIDNDNPSLEEGKDGKFTVEEKATVDNEVQSDADRSCSLVAPTIPLLVEQLKTTDEAHPSLPNPNASNTMSVHNVAAVPDHMHHHAPKSQVLTPIQPAHLWDPGPKEQSVEKGEVGERKVGVDEDSLLALLLEEAPDEVNHLPHMSDLPTVISTRERDRSSTYTARYPSGQISFKLYDWNPGDFPRNLRQQNDVGDTRIGSRYGNVQMVYIQILEWLSNMPVELEGYIRSGCTILTLFIAMPQSMWDKLYVDWAGAVRKLVQGPQSVAGFWDQGYFKAKLGWKTVHFVDGQLVNRSGGKKECMPCMPVLKSVQPICFEAASEGQLTVSGENLLHPNTRLLVSAGGKYLNGHVVQSCHENAEDKWKIIIPASDCSQVGPLFIEVENEGGTSNSMTVLVGDRNLCSELERLELEVSRGCEQDLVFDLCWMLRDSSCQHCGACRRLQDLFLYAKACGWHSLAEYVLQAAGRKGMLPEVTKVGDKTYPFRGDMDAPQALMVLPTMVLEWNSAHLLPPFKKDRKFGKKDVHITVDSGRDTLVPLIPKQRRGSCNQSWGTYRVMAAVATVTVACAGVCLVLVHPDEVIQLSTSLHHRLWGQ